MAHNFVRTFRSHEEKSSASSEEGEKPSRAFVEFEKLATSKGPRIGTTTGFLRFLDCVVYVLAAIVAVLAVLLIVS